MRWWPMKTGGNEYDHGSPVKHSSTNGNGLFKNVATPSHRVFAEMSRNTMRTLFCGCSTDWVARHLNMYYNRLFNSAQGNFFSHIDGISCERMVSYPPNWSSRHKQCQGQSMSVLWQDKKRKQNPYKCAKHKSFFLNYIILNVRWNH